MRGSLRDVALVARFEVVRAIRTWRALALVVLYLVATAGAGKIFVELLSTMETALAHTLRVPPTDRPGAMTAKLLEGEELRSMLEGMVGDPQLVEGVLSHPLLAIFHLWLGLLLVPFFASANAAESISGDLKTRAVRWEAHRTGRLEIVFGRYLGQAGLTLAASVLSILATWIVGMVFMVRQPPLGLLVSLASFTVRAWAFGMAFVGLAMACSALTASPAWARVLAIGAAAGTWVLYGIARWGSEEWGAGIVWDALLQALPQGWMRGLWLPGVHWVPSAFVCLAFGLAATSAGALRFVRRDL